MYIQWNLYFTNQLGIDLFVKSKSTYNRILLSNQLNSTYVAYNTQAHYRKPVIHLRSHVVRRKRSYLCLRPDTGMPWKRFWVNHRYKALSRLESVAFLLSFAFNLLQHVPSSKQTPLIRLRFSLCHK